MNVVVAGLSPRDEAAFGFFMSRSMKGWSWESTPAGRGTVLPKADLLVADLVSLGLAHWSEAAEAELLRVLQGSTAVLLVPSHDRTWASMDAGTVKQHALVWLAKPYGSEDMRKALETAAAVHRAAPPVPAPAAAPGQRQGVRPARRRPPWPPRFRPGARGRWCRRLHWRRLCRRSSRGRRFPCVHPPLCRPLLEMRPKRFRAFPPPSFRRGSWPCPSPVATCSCASSRPC